MDISCIKKLNNGDHLLALNDMYGNLILVADGVAEIIETDEGYWQGQCNARLEPTLKLSKIKSGLEKYHGGGE